MNWQSPANRMFNETSHSFARGQTDRMSLKEVNCYNCGSTENEPYAEENGYRLVRCKSCKLLYVRFRPEDSEITQAHETGQHGGATTFEVTGSFSRQRLEKYRRVLADFYGDEDINDSSLRWLDIGCGHGEFLVALQEQFGKSVQATGIEPNRFKQASARRRGLSVSFFDLDEHEETYDRLSLLNVYSHLADPPAKLGAWRRLFSGCGEILIQTGDTAQLKSEDHYRPFYLPDHLSFASERIVVDILERLNFEIVKIRKYPLLEHDAITWLKETVKIAVPGKPSRLRYLIANRRFPDTDMFIRARVKS